MNIEMIGQNIASLRRMNNLTQEKLVEALDIEQIINIDSVKSIMKK